MLKSTISSQNCSSNFEGKAIVCKIFESEFWLTEVIFLGHVVSGNGIFVDPRKVKVIVNWERRRMSSRFKVS